MEDKYVKEFPAMLREIDLDLIRMKYAFAMQFVEQVIEADEIVREEELNYFAHCFPKELIEKLQLTDPMVRLELYQISLEELPKRLLFEEKLDLFGLLLGASVADDELEFREFGVLEAAAKVLGLNSEVMMDYIDQMFTESL